MEWEIIILSEVNQTEKHHMTYMWNLKKKKKDTNELIYKAEINPQAENKLTVTKRERGEAGTN